MSKLTLLLTTTGEPYLLLPSNDVQAILVWSTSRFMRNVEHARAHKAALKRVGKRVVAITQETADDPNGRLIEGFYELIDEHESLVNGSRTVAAMRQNAKQGNINGSPPPYGFRREKVPVPGKEETFKSRFVHDATEAELVREIFRLYIAGRGAKRVAAQLNERGLRYRTGSFWSKDKILKIIADSVAAGRYFWGRFDSQTGELRDEADWVLIPVGPIVTEEQFALAQKVRAKHDPKKSLGRTGSSPMLLAGLVACARCGKSYQLETSGKPTAKAGGHRYYNCRSYVREGRVVCEGFRIPAEVLDHCVLEYLASELFTPDVLRNMVKSVVEDSGVLRERTASQRRTLQKELDDAQKGILRWEYAFEKGTLEPEDGVERLRALRKQRVELQAALARIAPVGAPPPYLYTDATIERFRDVVRRVFAGADQHLARTYITMLVSGIVVDGENIRVTLNRDAAVRLLASGEKTAEVSGETPVLTSACKWLPE